MVRSGSRREFIAAAATVVTALTLTLAGCSAASVPANTPSPTTPPVASLTVSTSGIGNLTVGNAVSAFDLVDYGEHTCPSTGGWLPRYPLESDTSSGQPLHPFDIVTKGGRASTAITNEYVWSPAIATARGIHVGSTLAEVEAAYPSATRKHSYTTALFVVSGPQGQLVIEVASDNEDARGEWPTATLDTVVWMQVIPKNTKATSIAGNNEAGPCPVKEKVPDLDGD